VTQGFWDDLKKTGKLHIQHCDQCGQFQHFPEAVCTRCGVSAHLSYKPVSGLGEVYSFVVTHQTRIPGLADEVPYVIAWIELPEQKGLRLVTNVLNCDVASVRVGMPVRLVVEMRGDFALPQFEPRSA
jgi:uncharacterized OB-fold protein